MRRMNVGRGQRSMEPDYCIIERFVSQADHHAMRFDHNDLSGPLMTSLLPLLLALLVVALLSPSQAAAQWEKRYVAPPPFDDPYKNYLFRDVHVFDDATVYLLAGSEGKDTRGIPKYGLIWRTLDTGATWEEVNFTTDHVYL